MNSNTTLKRAMPLVAAAALLALGSMPAFAGVDCANPQGVGQARGCAMAAQGSTELRRFVQRTAPIYLLSYRDFADAVPPATAAKTDDVRVALQK
jgi:hypothetical protein